MMSTKSASVLFIVTMIASSCTKPVEEVSGCQFPSKENMTLTWSDDFDSEFINTEFWSYDTATGCRLDTVPFDTIICDWGIGQLQYYTMREENARVEEGKLVITAIKESPFYQGKSHTSARLVTKNKVDFRFGRVEVRAKIPTGQGLWPGIWMLPTDTLYGRGTASGEIHIMENIGSNSEEVFGAIYYGHDFERSNSQSFSENLDPDSVGLGESPLVDFSDDFHVYSVSWTKDCILFQVDGIDIGAPNTRSSVLPTTWPFDQDFHLMLNVAVGGELPGNPSFSTQFPQTMEVDYVRVYQ